MKKRRFLLLLCLFVQGFSGGCAVITDELRPGLAALRLANGYEGRVRGRLRLPPSEVLELVLDETVSKDQKLSIFKGIQREFPKLQRFSSDAQGDWTGATVRVYVEPLRPLPGPQAGLAAVPSQLGLGPSMDVQLRFTWVDLRAGTVLAQTTVGLRRRFLLGGDDYLRAMEELAARHAAGMKAG